MLTALGIALAGAVLAAIVLIAFAAWLDFANGRDAYSVSGGLVTIAAIIAISLYLF